MRINNKKLIDNVSMGASINSAAQQLDHIYGFSIQLVFTGTPNGSFKMQCSNDDVETGSQVVNWTDVANSAQAITAAGDMIYNYDGSHFKWVRLVYTRSSGTGTLNGQIYIKGV